MNSPSFVRANELSDLGFFIFLLSKTEKYFTTFRKYLLLFHRSYSFRIRSFVSFDLPKY